MQAMTGRGIGAIAEKHSKPRLPLRVLSHQQNQKPNTYTSFISEISPVTQTQAKHRPSTPPLQKVKQLAPSACASPV